MHFGASAVGANGRRRDAGDAAAHLPGAATKQMPPRPCGLGTPAKCIGYFLTDPYRPLGTFFGRKHAAGSNRR